MIDDSHFELSIHSDACNMPTRPLYGVYKAVTRRDDEDQEISDSRVQTIDVVTGIKSNHN